MKTMSLVVKEKKWRRNELIKNDALNDERKRARKNVHYFFSFYFFVFIIAVCCFWNRIVVETKCISITIREHMFETNTIVFEISYVKTGISKRSRHAFSAPINIFWHIAKSINCNSVYIYIDTRRKKKKEEGKREYLFIYLILTTVAHLLTLHHYLLLGIAALDRQDCISKEAS